MLQSPSAGVRSTPSRLSPHAERTEVLLPSRRATPRVPPVLLSQPVRVAVGAAVGPQCRTPGGSGGLHRWANGIAITSAPVVAGRSPDPERPDCLPKGPGWEEPRPESCGAGPDKSGRAGLGSGREQFRAE